MTLEELLDDIRKQPEFVSVESLPISDFLTNQLKVFHNGETMIDRDTVLISSVFVRDDTARRPVCLILNNDHLSSMPKDSGVAKSLIEEIVYCGCDVCLHDKGSGSYSNILENMGDPPTYYINPVTHKATRIYSFEVPSITITPEISELIEKLKQLSGVNRVLIEYARCEEIKKIVNDDSAIVVSLYTNLMEGPITTFYSLSLLNNPDAHPSIVDTMENNLVNFTS